MKIGVFTDSYRPYTSGVVRSIELFSREFNLRGHEVYIFGPNYPLHRCPREEKVFRFVSIPAPTMPDFALPIPISAQLGSTLRRIGLDIIHVHSPFLLGRMGARAARRYKLPLVFTFHTLYDQYVHYLPVAQKSSQRLMQIIGRDFCNRCDLVVTPSKLVMNYLHRIGVNAAIKTIPTGVDIDEFSGADPRWLQENYGVRPEERVLLFVGRLGKEKNVLFLLKSFRMVQEIIPNLKLVLVGKGPLEGELQRLCLEMGIQDKVIFTGVLPRPKVMHCYAGAHLFVFPSVTETQGLVIGEAKAAGLPVVAVRAYGPAETVQHGEDGLLTDLSLSAFTESILLLLRDPHIYRSMKQKALDNAPLLSSSYCANQMLEAYQNLIDSVRTAKP